MSDNPFTREETAILVERLQTHLATEYDVALGTFDAETLLGFLAREIGGAFYNKGLHDAHAAISARMDEVGEVVYQMERPSAFDRRG
ncbi:DUF2164 domain-containing protein [Stappia sp.]|uniref:DUF2164 domain-containing protein n=1 Tax=Stappia sp. TaxID=1870903 RepID=UPI0032D95B92